MSDPFAVADTGGVNIKDYEGYLLLVTPTEYIENVDTTNGPTDVVDADMVVLDGEDAPEEIDGVRIFQNVLIGALRKRIGKKQNMLLGRLAISTEKKKGQNAPWIFQAPTDEDKEVARKYIESKKADDPFAV